MAANEVSVEQPVTVYHAGTSDENAAADVEQSEDAAAGSQNGLAVCQTDRFGFCGGHQYTDPSGYVSLISLFPNLVLFCDSLNDVEWAPAADNRYWSIAAYSLLISFAIIKNGDRLVA